MQNHSNHEKYGFIGIGVLSGVASLILVFALQYFKNMEPCSLCWIQRGEIALMVLGFLISMKWIRSGGAIALFCSIAGFATALLQLFEVLGRHPAFHTCQIIPGGAPSCAVEGAKVFLGLPLVMWAITAFAFWIAFSFGYLIFARRNY